MYKELNLEPCPNCGRKFLFDKLQVHLKGCKEKGNGGLSSTKMLEDKLKSQLKEDNNSQKKKPNFLMCYICGREFSKFSLEIHINQCIEKYVKEEKNKNPNSKVKVPDPPEELVNILEKVLSNVDLSNEDYSNYNEAANSLYKEHSLKTCNGCGRKFLPDSLKVHLKSCKSASPKKEDMKSPKMISRPRMLMCPLCGREFGTTSLEIHMKQCKNKFEREQENLPKNLRRSADDIINKFNQNQAALKSSGNYQLDNINSNTYEIWSKDALVPCDICGRTFLPDRLIVHQRSCKPKKVI